MLVHCTVRSWLYTVSMWQDLPDLSKMWGPDGPPGPFPSSVAHVPKLKLTIYKDKEQIIPVREVGKLSLPAFAKL